MTIFRMFESMLMSNNLEYSSLKLDYYEVFEKKESFQLDNDKSTYTDEKTLKFEKEKSNKK